MVWVEAIIVNTDWVLLLISQIQSYIDFLDQLLFANGARGILRQPILDAVPVKNVKTGKHFAARIVLYLA